MGAGWCVVDDAAETRAGLAFDVFATSSHEHAVIGERVYVSEIKTTRLYRHLVWTRREGDSR